MTPREAGVDCWDPAEVSTVAGGEIGGAITMLQALAIADRESRFVVPRVEPVVTIPDSSFPVRRTRSVLAELFAGARDEILIAGYQVSDPELIVLLGEATTRGVRLEFFVDKRQGALATLRAGWPDGARAATVWVGDLRTSRYRNASMHAKAIVIDGKRAFVSSANLTRNAMRANVEVGLLVDGEPAAGVRALLIRLVRSNQFNQEVIEARPFGHGVAAT